MAWLWYAGYGVAAIVIVAFVWAGAVAAQDYGRHLIRRDPMRALAFLEKRLIAVGIASAAGAAVAIIATVELSAAKDAATSTTELLGATSSALAAFFVGLTVSGEDADGKVGEFVRSEFQKQYCGALDPRPNGRCKLPRGTAYYALYSGYEQGWTDWSEPNRHARIEALAKYLGEHPEVTRTA